MRDVLACYMLNAMFSVVGSPVAVQVEGWMKPEEPNGGGAMAVPSSTLSTSVEADHL